MSDNNATGVESAPNQRPRLSPFSDPDGQPSLIRVMSFISFFVSIWFGWLTINDERQTVDAGLYLTSAFLIGAFAPKALVVFIEKAYPRR